MLAAPTLDISFDKKDDDWISSPPKYPLGRTASAGSSWKVTSIGRGFDWSSHIGEAEEGEDRGDADSGSASDEAGGRAATRAIEERMPYVSPSGAKLASPIPTLFARTADPPSAIAGRLTLDPISTSPSHSPPSAARPPSHPSSTSIAHPASSPSPYPITRSPTTPSLRQRRRSSQQRVSLFAGRVSITPVEPHSPPPAAPPKLIRASSTASLLSSVPSAEAIPPPSNAPAPESSERNISEFVIQGEIGRGAYGLVKRAREMQPDGTLGPSIVIKQVIKSRILADCWKKHPKYGTIPIEIYVMSSISNTSYVLPPPRPWDPSRASRSGLNYEDSHDDLCWMEGKVTKGHPNICPLLDFFEDANYYYLVLPSSVPEPAPNQPVPPSDLFDLVESYPEGLPPQLIRTYLGQIADALSFLHSRGIVHRDIKDENVVLGANDKAVLIDFGSSGLVKRGGWDTFSGTLDYAGPEILRGERYGGKEQDVWAFGVVAYVLLVGECPFTTAEEAQEGLVSPFSNASIALDERCLGENERAGEESDGGGALVDAAALVRACLQLEVSARPTFDRVMQSRFLSGGDGWSVDDL